MCKSRDTTASPCPEQLVGEKDSSHAYLLTSVAYPDPRERESYLSSLVALTKWWPRVSTHLMTETIVLWCICDTYLCHSELPPLQFGRQWWHQDPSNDRKTVNPSLPRHLQQTSQVNDWTDDRPPSPSLPEIVNSIMNIRIKTSVCTNLNIHWTQLSSHKVYMTVCENKLI